VCSMRTRVLIAAGRRRENPDIYFNKNTSPDTYRRIQLGEIILGLFGGGGGGRRHWPAWLTDVYGGSDPWLRWPGGRPERGCGGSTHGEGYKQRRWRPTVCVERARGCVISVGRMIL
jgi:hypothetical protein